MATKSRTYGQDASGFPPRYNNGLIEPARNKGMLDGEALVLYVSNCYWLLY